MARFVEGFALLGHVEEPALFRVLDGPRPPPWSLGLESAQGTTASSVGQICSSLRLHEHSQLNSCPILLVMRSVRGSSGPFLCESREQLDDRYGADQWLPMKCFARTQSARKTRPIDDGGSCGRNEL